jgi:hypothetical protein
MATPVDKMIDAACLTCTCCGETQAVGCVCWKDYIDHCHFRCVLHCKRPECKRRRKNGLWRINWAGTRHLYFNGDERTLCGRRMPTTGYALRVPTVGLRGGECARCTSALHKLAAEAAPPSHL